MKQKEKIIFGWTEYLVLIEAEHVFPGGAFRQKNKGTKKGAPFHYSRTFTLSTKMDFSPFRIEKVPLMTIQFSGTKIS